VNGTGVRRRLRSEERVQFPVRRPAEQPDATSLSDSIYSLAEVGYTMTPFSLPEGTIALVQGQQRRRGVEAGGRRQHRSEVHAGVDAFGRYGTQTFPAIAISTRVPACRSVPAWRSIPWTTWGIGYAQMNLASGDKEKLTEGYYNFQSHRALRLSFSLQHVLDSPSARAGSGTCSQAVRLQASF
jgi:hypothetical protein